MKILLIALAFAAVAHGQTTNRIGVLFKPPIGHGTNSVYNVYSSTNLSLPMVQWPWFTNSSFESVTNLGGIEIPAGTDASRYYAVKGSNFQGETSFFGPPVESRRLSTEVPVSIGQWLQRSDSK